VFGFRSLVPAPTHDFGATDIKADRRFLGAQAIFWLTITIVTVVSGLWANLALGQQQIVSLPTVHVLTKAITFDNRPALLVRSITIGNLEGDRLRVSCDNCRRYPTEIHEARPQLAIKTYSGVSWIIIDGHDIQVEVTRSGRIGRFLLLGASPRQGLAFEASGCLSRRRRRVLCPKNVEEPKRGSLVSGGALTSGPSQTQTPVTKIISGPSTLQTTLPVTFTYSSSISRSTFQCALDGAAWSTCPPTGTSYPVLTEGRHTFGVRAIAPDGEADSNPPSFTWTQDTAPSTTITNGPTGNVATGDVSFEFSSSKPDSTFQCQLDGGSWSTCSGDAQAYSNLAEGVHTFTVRAVDSLGGVDPDPASQSWNQVSPYGVTSYNRMQPGAPYHNVFESAYQAFVAQSNTITSLGVTVGNPAYPTGAVNFDIPIKLCTNQPNAQGDCNAIGEVSTPVINYGDSQGYIGEIPVTPGGTYWIVYLPPQPLGNGWVTYWWSGGSHITESEQMQAIVEGYNR
jgi:hypothetical protein